MVGDIHSRIREHNCFSESFRDERLANSLRRAQQFAGEKGRAASLPELIFYARWGGPYTANTQRYVVRDGNDTKFLIIHGSGPLSDPDRLENLSYEPLDFGGGIRLTQEENNGLVAGLNEDIPYALVRGRYIPVFPYENIPKGSEALLHYGIEMDFSLARSMPSGRLNHEELGQNHLFLADCGWPENALHYFWMHSGTEEEIELSHPETEQLVGEHFDPKVTRLRSDILSARNKISIANGKAMLYEHPLAIVNPFVPQGHFVHYGSSEQGFLSDIALTRGLCDEADTYKGISSGYDVFRYARFLTICEQTEQWKGMNPEEAEILLQLTRTFAEQ